jgi:transcriptional regulator of acetoin/glycerol metabolism
VAIAERLALAVDGWLERDHMDTELVSRRYRWNDGISTGTGSKVLKLPTAPVRLGEPMGDDEICEGIVGRSVALRNVLTQLETVAPTDSTVLICGETGTGKELIARALHNLSTRRGNALVKCNCAAIPTGLLESELFGHEKGAFTGAVGQRIGRFELANRGRSFSTKSRDAAELQPKLPRPRSVNSNGSATAHAAHR